MPEHGYKYLGHIAFGALTQAVYTALMSPFAIAVTLGWLNVWQLLVIAGYVAGNVAHWFSRERRDTDKDFGLDPHREFFRKMNPFRWKPGTRADFFGPVLSWGAATAIACYLLRGV